MLYLSRFDFTLKHVPKTKTGKSVMTFVLSNTKELDIVLSTN